MPFQLFSSGFPDGGWLPALHSCEGADLSPSLEWSGAPSETRSLALIVEDPDAPAGVWCHWLLYDVGPRIQALPQGFKPGSLGISGTNDFGKQGYGGPCPPSGVHRYYFHLHALNTDLTLPPGASRKELETSMKGHVLGEARLMGRYGRK